MIVRLFYGRLLYYKVFVFAELFNILVVLDVGNPPLGPSMWLVPSFMK